MAGSNEGVGSASATFLTCIRLVTRALSLSPLIEQTVNSIAIDRNQTAVVTVTQPLLTI